MLNAKVPVLLCANHENSAVSQLIYLALSICMKKKIIGIRWNGALWFSCENSLIPSLSSYI